MLDVALLLAQLDCDGEALASAAATAGWDAPVPATRWNVRKLVLHTGGVHRWATATVAGGLRQPDRAASAAVGKGPPDDDLLAWFLEGHAVLVAALRAAPDDLVAFTFLPAPSPKSFWTRRQAHETAIHRLDAQGAAGAVTGFDADFAQDGLDEMLGGFARRSSNAVPVQARLGLRATDGPDRIVTFGGERNVAEVSDAPADADVSGTSSDLYRWVWNRPAAVEISGDRAVAHAWKSIRVRWG